MRHIQFIAAFSVLLSACTTNLSAVDGIGKSVAYFQQQNSEWSVTVNNRWRNELQIFSIQGNPRGRPLLSEQGNVTVFVTDAGLFLADSNDASVRQIADAVSGEPSLSIDGRFVVFVSDSPHLVADDTNGVPDVFLFDRTTGNISRQSVLPDGSQIASAAALAAVSADARHIVFRSAEQLYIRDAMKGTTALTQ